MDSSTKTFLLTRPNFDLLTSYFFYWSKALIEHAEAKGIHTVDIAEKKVTKKEFTGRLKKVRPQLLLLNGHGNQLQVAGQDNEIILDEKSSHLLEGAVIYARACKSGLMLGRIAVDKGAKAYIGYNVDFYMGYNKDIITHPLEDKIAEMYMNPSNQVINSLLKGNSVQDASNRSKTMSLKTIQSLTISEADPEDLFHAKLLWSNMRAQTVHGDLSATI